MSLSTVVKAWFRLAALGILAIIVWLLVKGTL